jgi:hypothetical protein
MANADYDNYAHLLFMDGITRDGSQILTQTCFPQLPRCPAATVSQTLAPFYQSNAPIGCSETPVTPTLFPTFAPTFMPTERAATSSGASIVLCGMPPFCKYY